MTNLLDSIITRLHQLTRIDIQHNWYYCDQEIEEDFDDLIIADWEIAKANDKGYLVWSSGSQVRWFIQKFVIPNNLQGYPLGGLALRLVLTWWAEDAQVFVNGKLVQSGDLFDSSARILLTKQAIPGAEFLVALRLVSPGHDIGGLMESFCLYEANQVDEKISIDPSFVADELEVLHKYLAAFEPERIARFSAEVNQIDWEKVNHANDFNHELLNLRKRLQPLANNLKQRCFHLLGHAHLDMAWLWKLKETWDVGKRTFASVINLQQDFPELTFCHTSPLLYTWIEKHYPQLFQEIQTAVNNGQWEVLGGMWIEPEVNLISGESLVRQLLYGQLYIKEKFGHFTEVAWLPDSFGFSWQLPQIFKQAGIKYFVTGKLHWNDTNKFPYGAFWWQGLDGTKLFTLMSPPNLAGVMDTNPITMANYAVSWEQQTGLQDAFWLPGVGDHGGGPSRDMLEVQKRWQQSPFFPCLQFTKAIDYLQLVSASKSASNQFFSEVRQQETARREQGQELTEIVTEKLFCDKSNKIFPIWNDELYLELHRGCYTTHGDQKLFNRRSEGLLYQAELFACLAKIVGEKGKFAYVYPQEKLTEAWKKVLLNQFHDILPGTSIPEVFVDANQAWEEVETVGREILQESLRAIASQVILPTPPQTNAKPLFVFNPLNWQRSELITVDCQNCSIYNLAGEKLLSQISYEEKLLFLAEDIPAVGYCLFWLCPNQVEINSNQAIKFPSELILENEFLKVIIHSKTGDLSSIFDKINQQEILSGAGNQLQSFTDRGQYWDAWNIDPDYQKYSLPPTQLQSIQWLETGELRWRVRVVRSLGTSEFCQDYILVKKSPILTISNTVNWQEKHVLVKAAFPLNLSADYASYEIPGGVIKRPTNPQTSFEKAKWEVPALHWADLTGKLGNEKQDLELYGVSLLNDCKYGYDSKPEQIRLTLLRSPTWPDPQADRGIHHFSYGIYPHIGNWQLAHTVRKGYEFNLPLQKIIFDKIDVNTNKSLPTVGKLLDLQAENLILMALKQSEHNSDVLILRCYESYGHAAQLNLASDLDLSITNSVDLLEQPLSVFSEKLQIKPWQIASFSIKTNLPT